MFVGGKVGVWEDMCVCGRVPVGVGESRLVCGRVGVFLREHVCLWEGRCVYGRIDWCGGTIGVCVGG